MIVTVGAVVSELTMKDAVVRKSQDVPVHAAAPGAALALPAASLNFVAATVTVIGLPSLAGHSSVHAVPEPAIAGAPLDPQLVTVMSCVVASCSNKSVTGVSLRVKVNVTVAASL